MLKKPAAVRGTKEHANVKLFDLYLNVDRVLGGELDDWPANLQDAVLEAVERKADEVKLPLSIIHSYCTTDMHGQPYVHVVASEVVALIEGPSTCQ